MAKTMFSVTALVVAVTLFGVGRPGVFSGEVSSVIGGLPECNASYYDIEECHGTGCPTDFKNYKYTYFGSEDLLVTSTEICANYQDYDGIPCAGSAQNDTVNSYCEEFFWDWW